MKHLKSYKIFEREMSAEWFEKNPKNYLVANQSKAKAKVKQLNLFSNVNWKDIVVKEPDYDEWGNYKSPDVTKFMCYYKDSMLMSFGVHHSRSEWDSGDFNRIHTGHGLRPEYKNLGLGYKCYKAVIDKVGFVRSDECGTNADSRKIWSHLIKDPDYFAFEVETEHQYASDDRTNGFMVFKKSMGKPAIDKILKEFIEAGNKIITQDPNF